MRGVAEQMDRTALARLEGELDDFRCFLRRWSPFPLRDRILRRFHKDGIPPDNVSLFRSAVTGHSHAHAHDALQIHAASQRRINRNNASDHAAGSLDLCILGVREGKKTSGEKD